MFHKDQTKMIKFKKNFTFEEILVVIEQNFSVKDISLKFKDTKGDLVLLQSQNELEYLFENTKDNNTIEIIITSSKDFVDIKKLDPILNQLSVSELKELIYKLIPSSTLNIKDTIRNLILARQFNSTNEEEEPEIPELPQNKSFVRNSNTKLSPQQALFNELEEMMKGGKITLKKVDTLQEIENRNRVKEKNKFESLMEEIRHKSKQRKLILLDQGIVHPKEFWKQSLGRWLEEIEKAFTADSLIMKLIFLILEQNEDEIPFKDALSMISASISADLLATSLNCIGFTIKRNYFIDNSKEKIDYCSIIRPSNFPVKFMLRAILLFLGKNESSLITKNEILIPDNSTCKSSENPQIMEELEDLLQDII